MKRSPLETRLLYLNRTLAKAHFMGFAVWQLDATENTIRKTETKLLEVSRDGD